MLVLVILDGLVCFNCVYDLVDDYLLRFVDCLVVSFGFGCLVLL